MKTVTKLGAAMALGISALALTAPGASAMVVCNRAGECWHAHKGFVARPEMGVVVHPNGWRWGAREHFVWREHPGRGYWRNGVWVTF
jgi:hypothetical protein